MNEIQFEKFLKSKSSQNLKSIIHDNQMLETGEYKVSRNDLLRICDAFLEGYIDKTDLEKLGFDLIFSDFFTWEDEVVDDIIFCWDNPTICYEINTMNVELFKDYLITGVSKLADYNLWRSHINRQQELCKKYSVAWKPFNPKLHLGVADDIKSDPLNGLRHPPERGTSGWYLWSGEYRPDADFFKPLCAEHLIKIRPEIIKYLGLPPGYRFQIDSKGYEDIWEDKSLFEI